MINNDIQIFLDKINKLREYLEEWVLETRIEQDLIIDIRNYNYDNMNDEILLLKVKKLKSHPQTIYSSQSSRWYSSAISEYILEWEELFKKYIWKNGVNCDKIIIAQQNFVTRINENIFLVLIDKLWQLKYDEIVIEICKKLPFDSTNNEIRFKNYLIWWYSYKSLNILTNNDYYQTIKILNLLKNINFNIYNFDLEKLIDQCYNDTFQSDGVDLKWNIRTEKNPMDNQKYSDLWLLFNKLNWDVKLNWEYLWTVTVWNKEYDFFEYLYDNKWIPKDHSEIMKYLKEDEKIEKTKWSYLSDIKRRLPVKVRSQIQSPKWKYYIP